MTRRGVGVPRGNKVGKTGRPYKGGRIEKETFKPRQAVTNPKIERRREQK